MKSSSPSVSVQSFSGTAALPFLPALAQLRIEVFRDFPYLYDGNLAYEENCLNTLAQAENAVLVVAFDGDKVVGDSTGLPLAEETENIQKPFAERNFDIRRIFYFGESVLKKAYRGQGIGVEFFNQRESWAGKSGDFEWTTFCGVIRPPDHPLRPAGYVPLDRFWQKRGYSPRPGLVCQMNWQDTGALESIDKQLQFWMKKL